MKYYTKQENENSTTYTFFGTVFDTISVESLTIDTDHDNPMMVLLELQYDKDLDNLWLFNGRQNKENFIKLEDYYIKDKVVFNETYRKCAEAVIEQK